MRKHSVSSVDFMLLQAASAESAPPASLSALQGVCVWLNPRVSFTRVESIRRVVHYESRVGNAYAQLRINRSVEKLIKRGYTLAYIGILRGGETKEQETLPAVSIWVKLGKPEKRSKVGKKSEQVA